ncbi:hypothetical protein DVT68_18080 [Dyella solisilvae]|uniref:Uncharacterized protein n=1 Tax=Dyella solisilvae TaxID=1920168 RepID=A0A370K3Q4_9GAMM|nr:hypothetical protein [Dyella solisilvae]RDI97259.1 hypothetical protein DVT68_18080 [Dyella solisilvae]
MKSSALVLVLLAALASSFQAHAVGRLVDLTVYDRTAQQELPVYRYDGRYYVAGQPGHRYQIELRNQEGARVLGVLSVDGVNVLSGDTADWSQTGYVLNPFAMGEILGWRKSLSEVADFVFADASRSYAARTGRPDNVGVIGMAIFRARPLIRPMPMAQAPARAAEEATTPAAPIVTPAPGMPMAGNSSIARVMPYQGGPIGTGHGQREGSVVTYTAFQRASDTPDDVVTLYYDTRERLIAQGVIPGSYPPVPSRPDPFPGHFVPDPR